MASSKIKLPVAITFIIFAGLKNRILIMILLFGLSQLSGLVISLSKYNRDYISILIEEENEKEETESSYSDDKYYCMAHTFNPILWIVKEQLYPDPDTRIHSSYSNKPETPPPNFC